LTKLTAQGISTQYGDFSSPNIRQIPVSHGASNAGFPRRYILKPDIRNDWQDQNPKTPREKFPTKRVVASEDVRLSIAKALL
jgi:hypothetical protein